MYAVDLSRSWGKDSGFAPLPYVNVNLARANGLRLAHSGVEVLAVLGTQFARYLMHNS